MKYMMLFWVDESAETTADEDAAMMVAVKSWVDQMTERGIMVHGGALRSACEAAIVHVRDGEVLVSDGPFAETKEQIGGYGVIECADRDAAIRVAAEHPLARTAKVEVRPALQPGGPVFGQVLTAPEFERAVHQDARSLS